MTEMAKPHFFRRFWEGWKRIAYKIGWFNSIVIFSILYLGVFGVYFLISLPFRILHRQKSTDSFWVKRSDRDRSIDYFKRQF